MSNFRFATLGETNAGKTSLAHVLGGHRFTEFEAPTIGAAFQCLTETPGRRDDDRPVIRIQLWDTAGAERYRSLIALYTRDLDACLIVADLGRSDCVQAVTRWVDYLRQSANTTIAQQQTSEAEAESKRNFDVGSAQSQLHDHPTVVWVIGSKRDLVKDNSEQENNLRSYAAERGFKFASISSATGTGIAELRDSLFAQCRTWSWSNATRPDASSIRLAPPATGAAASGGGVLGHLGGMCPCQ